MPELFCRDCGVKLANKPWRVTEYCARHVNRHLPKCSDCGRMLGKNGLHKCGSVDLKGPRFCGICSKPLSNKGYERWKNNCPQCEKKKFRDGQRELRRQLRVEFGGACQICGYTRCWAALHFHHLDSSEKYDWNEKGKGGSSLREIKRHPERFQLVCANCHIEIHQGVKHEEISSK
jgi:hypothetical protein